MPSDDSSAAQGLPFSLSTELFTQAIKKATQEELRVQANELKKRAEEELKGLQKQRPAPKMQGLHHQLGLYDEIQSLPSKYEDLGRALGISAHAAMDLTNAFTQSVEMVKPPSPKKPAAKVDVEEMYAEMEGEIAAFRVGLPEDPVLRAVEVIERGDELADNMTMLMNQALEEREGSDWMKRMVIDLDVTYRSATEDLLFTLTTRRMSGRPRGEWHESFAARPEVEQGFIPVAILEGVEQGLALKRTLVQICQDLANGPHKYAALLRGPAEVCL